MACVLKVGITEPEETAVAKQWLCKNFSTATEWRDPQNRHECNNRETVGSGVFYAIVVEVI
jgi:hypothetical protein